MNKAGRITLKILRILGKTLLGILIFLLLVVLFIRSPWGQDIIKDKLISSIEKKTGGEIELEKLFITFDGDIEINELYLADPDGDTVAYAKSISANIGLWPLIRGNGFSLNQLEANDLKARITRQDSIEGYNYEFLTRAYATDTTQTQAADTTSAPMEISIGDIALNNIDVVYQDDVSGIDSKFNFQELVLEFSETDLENMIFRVNEAMLKEADINYVQTKPFPESDSEPPPLPIIEVDRLEFSNVNVNYDSQPDSLSTENMIANLNLDQALFDLKNNNINLDNLKLANSEVSFNMNVAETTTAQNTDTESAFTWPDWNISVASIDLLNNDIKYSLNDAQPQNGQFDPNAINLQELIFKASELSYAQEKLTAKIDQVQFQEASGIDVKEFNLTAVVTDEEMSFTNIGLAVNQNSLSGTVTLTYNELQGILENPGEATVNLDLNKFNLSLQDIFRFQPSLRENEYIKALARAPISGAIQANGKLDNLNINPVRLNWSNTSISGSGRVVNLQDPDNLSFNFPNLKMRSQRSDLVNFVKEEDLGVKLPEQVSLNGSFRGNTSDIETSSVLVTTYGSLKVDGNFSTGDQIVFDAEVQGDSIALGNLLQNEALGDIQLKLKAKGSGETLDGLNAELSSEITSFTYNNYEFKNIDINGDIRNGSGSVNLFYLDENLDMEAQTYLELGTELPRIEFNVYLDGANLEALGMTQKTIKTGFQLEGWYQGTSTDYDVKAEIIDGVAVYNNKTYLLGNFDAFAYVRKDTTSVEIDNRILNLDMQSNANPAQFSAAIDRHFKRYITEDFKEDSIVDPVNLKLKAKISQTPLLNEVFLVNLEEMDTIDINVDFREKDREMDARVSIPYINYFNSKIDSLKLDMQSDAQDLNFELAFNELNSGPLAIKKTILNGAVVDQKLNLDFSSFYEEEPLVHVNSELNFQGDTLQFHVNPQDLILNRNPWQISESNAISYATGYVDFQDFRLFRNDQEMRLSNDKPGIEKEHLSLDFRNFKLAAILNYLNPENQLATGQLNGNIVYEEPFGETGLLADMQINQFKVMDVDLNTLSLKGNSAGFSNYDFMMSVKGAEVDLDLEGSYTAADPSAEIDMTLDLNEIQMSALEGFSQGEIKNGSGSFSGNISLNGTVLEPEYDGSLNFNNAKFNIAILNADFILPDEDLNLDNEGLYFNNFRINDTNENSVVVNGEILTEKLLNPVFDLDVQAQDFKLLNSTEEDNDLFYGTAVVDVDAQIKGDLNLPKVDMNLVINENTDFTYVVPETELQIKERDGVVIFVNKENPDAILTQTEEESYVISGYDIYSRVTVDEGATFNVILNPETGDKFQVQGEGDLIFNMYPNGRTALTGIYEINDGSYEVSLYNLVKREFDIADGSRVSWAGDPFDAQLDVRAIYRVETSASSLMAPTTSAIGDSNTGSYRRKYPFLVYLNVDGDLMSPKISFGLDMPEAQKGAGGGNVYGRVQQLNNQEQELNKQVFSLLVLNRFFPGSGSDGSSGGTLSVARDNLNSALSDQLNMLSSRILGESGVQLNFDVDSYTDYQGESPQERTQLGINAQKAFMEDRLIVEVGSEVDVQGGNQPGQETSPLIGNVSISYLLDESGIWRIKGFSRSQYENVIDGQLVVSGIALIFTREFNKFKNIFEKAVMEKVKNENDSKSKQQENSEDESED